MKTRSIGELLQVLLDNKEYFDRGLCFFIIDLFYIYIINLEEKNILKDFIFNHRPRNEFTSYYWPYGEWPPRQRWLKYWINKLKKGESKEDNHQINPSP